MTKLTKAQLVAKINQLEREVLGSAHEIEQLRLRCAQLSPIGRAAQFAPAPAQRVLPLHMQRARDMAMRTGKCVKAG